MYWTRRTGERVLKGLRSASGWLRRELGSALKLRYTPELVFQLDDSIDKGAHILELLRSVEGPKEVNRGPEGKGDLDMNERQTAEWLMERDDFLILTHVRPDGDTIGCAAGCVWLRGGERRPGCWKTRRPPASSPPIWRG